MPETTPFVRNPRKLPGMTDLLYPARGYDQIFPRYRGTPIADLLAYNNLGMPSPCYVRAELLIGMCMDIRKSLLMPANFAYVMRTGGANLRSLDFQISYAVSIGGVRAVCLIAHDNCSMVDLASRREQFVTGLIETAGWDRVRAEKHYDANASRFEIVDAVQFVQSETRRLGKLYPRLTVAPLFFFMEDSMLYQIDE